MSKSANQDHGTLARRLNLPLLVLYGTGVTVGAGIYVLIGAIAEHAGKNAPLAFVFAAIVMGLTVGSYAELCTRFPVAAGEAAYVRAAFHRRWLSTLTGLVMICSAVIASAAVALGAAGYVRQLIDVPAPLIVMVVIITLGMVSAWGILESVILASVFTVIEIGGLATIIVAAVYAKLPLGPALFSIPAIDSNLWSGIAFASLLAFFAFTGFEDLTNMAEETQAPERTIPIAMGLTLIVTTLLYVVIAAIAVTALPIQRLAGSDAPLSLVFQEVAGVTPVTITCIAIVATLNTIIAQMTMAIRVVYGMARQGDLPRVFGRVHHRTATPLIATALIVALASALALLAPFVRLAESTSLATLAIFAIVNLALLKLRWDGASHKRGTISVPIAIPVLGLATSLLMIGSALF